MKEKIFRGYDIRGVYPKDIVTSTAYTIGLAFGSKIQDLGKKKCVVGHDNRLSSDELYAALIEGIKETGVDIISLGALYNPNVLLCLHQIRNSIRCYGNGVSQS